MNRYKTVLLLLFLIPVVGSANGMWFSKDENDISVGTKYFGMGFVGSCALHFLGNTLVGTFRLAEQPLTVVTCLLAAGALVTDHFWSKSCNVKPRLFLKLCATALGIFAGSDYANLRYAFMINGLSGCGSGSVAVKG